MTKICIADFGAGNIYSVKRAFERCGAKVSVSCAGEDFENADGLVLPGDGNFGPASIAIGAFKEPLLEAVSSGKPFLGICAGMQLLFEGSDESPHAEGLRLFDGRLTRFEKGLSCPQMGWNRLKSLKGGLFEGVLEGEWAYFIHSYKADFSQFASAACEYGRQFVAAIERGNVVATQFHPEKSAKTGKKILRNFIRICRK
jgi:glutamine amidotransferase